MQASRWSGLETKPKESCDDKKRKRDLRDSLGKARKQRYLTFLTVLTFLTFLTGLHWHSQPQASLTASRQNEIIACREEKKEATFILTFHGALRLTPKHDHQRERAEGKGRNG